MRAAKKVEGKMSNNEFGCPAIIVMVLLFGIFIGAVSAIQNQGLREKVDELERRTAGPWNAILAQEYGKLRESDGL
jgi:hypothetical protein